MDSFSFVVPAPPGRWRKICSGEEFVTITPGGAAYHVPHGRHGAVCRRLMGDSWLRNDHPRRNTYQSRGGGPDLLSSIDRVSLIIRREAESPPGRCVLATVVSITTRTASATPPTSAYISATAAGWRSLQ